MKLFPQPSRKQPITLRRALLGALAVCLAGLAGFMVMALLIAPRLAQQMEYVAPEASVSDSDSGGSPAGALIAEHGCWSGSAPADMQGQLPGHAVVTKPGAIAPVYEGGRTVGAALEHVFESKYPRLTVHAFCR